MREKIQTFDQWLNDKKGEKIALSIVLWTAVGVIVTMLITDWYDPKIVQTADFILTVGALTFIIIQPLYSQKYCKWLAKVFRIKIRDAKIKYQRYVDEYMQGRYYAHPTCQQMNDNT